MSTKTREPTSSTRNNSKWEPMKEDIRRIYLTEHKTLVETRNEIKDIYNFSASERAWKYQLDDWHFNKKLTKEEKAFVLSKAQKRRLEEKETTFYHSGLLLDTNKIKSFKRQRISEESDTRPLAAKTPDAITYHTPENISEQISSLQPDLEMGISRDHRTASDYIQTTVYDEASVVNSSTPTYAHQPSSNAELLSHLPTLGQDITEGQDDAFIQSFIGTDAIQSAYVSSPRTHYWNNFPIESARISVIDDGVDQELGPAPEDCGTEYLVDVNTQGFTSLSDGINGLNNNIGSPIIFGSKASFLLTSSPSLNYVSLDTPVMAASDCGSLFDKDFDSEYCRELFSWTLDTAYSDPSLQRNSETRRGFSVALSDSFGEEPFPYVNLMHTLVQHLPWFQFQELVDRYGLNNGNVAFASALRYVGVSSTRLDGLSDDLNGEEICQALDERYKIVSGFLNVGLSDTIQTSVDKLTNQLLQLVPERSGGEVKTKVQHTFNHMNKFPAFQIFEWALYLSSNNLLSEDQTDNFLVWIIGEKLIGPLISLLEQKLPTLVAFAARILESAVRIVNPAVLSQLLESSIDSRAYRGPQGAIVLHELVTRYHLDVDETNPETYFELVRILLVNGAHPNVPESYCNDANALFYAACKKDFRMVELLAKFGANVNAISCPGSGPDTALACAVVYEEITSIKMLLGLGAKVDESHLEEVSILEWAATRSSSIYDILLKRSSLSKEVFHVAGILHAAKQSTLFNYIKQSEGFSKCTIQKYMECALMQAVTCNCENETIIETLLEFGVNPNTPTQSPEHPLRTALNDGNTITVKLLLNAGASINEPWALSAAPANFELMNLLIDLGADISTSGTKALCSAVALESLECVALLLRSGVDANSSYHGRTFLQWTAASRTIKIAQMLVKHGAIVNAPIGIHREHTALQLAANHGCYDMVEYLLNIGADVNAAPKKVDGMTALEAAAAKNMNWSSRREEKVRIFKLLLSRGAVFNRRPDDVGATRTTTTLHGLISTGEDELCCLAVSEGADVNVMTSGKEGRTPLQLAAEQGRLEIVKLLLNHGAQVNSPAAHRFGRTALQAAACCEFPALDIIQILLENGAEVNAEPAIEGGVTAIQGAAIQGHINVALALLKAHADVNAPSAIRDGRTAVEGAAEHGRLDMVKLLLKAGAEGDSNTGFEEAVKAAEKYNHFAIADLLREHMQRQAT